MKLTLKINLVAILFITISSCKTPFTQEIRNAVQAENIERIKKLQFYIDDDIEIVQKKKEKDNFIKGGKITFENGYYTNTLIFSKGTLCIGEHFGENKLKVYFDEGSSDYLTFGKSTKLGLVTFYELYGKKRDDGYYVKYGSEYTKLEKGFDTKLLIKKNYKQYTKNTKRKVKGIKVK